LRIVADTSTNDYIALTANTDAGVDDFAAEIEVMQSQRTGITLVDADN